MATFSVVATPIGNLGDLSRRAVATLAAADLLLCEDTRVTKKLLSEYGLATPTLSYHAHSPLGRESKIIQSLRDGRDVALVSDAGTPGISDPGAELVAHIRAELKDEISNGDVKIVAIPGPSALLAALSIAGVPCAQFTFFGFPPHKKGRQTLFREIATAARTAVFYESPHRIMKALESLAEYAPASKRLTVCRELTKVFEEIVQGTAAEVKHFFETHPDKIRGEFVVIVSS
ncbi:MAG: 16S rRNA (cytidine(1402)-2'-O)-methyltransferase [Patescibacteria group bacterium]|nr:16S rRNA (cytidine(1402)-2'-O)-methyltransferase [Patescibacteria group bacterium]MDE2172403.1 16S rRNA (cytidine(1402)-2'-O)-methyltransferase [Patescibacteria group bacterium]